jgi:hypothetical protein
MLHSLFLVISWRLSFMFRRFETSAPKNQTLENYPKKDTKRTAYLLHSVQTGSVANPACYAVGSGNKETGASS